MKIRGERGHPWRVPLDIEKAFDRRPLTLILAVGEVCRARIIRSMLGGKPMVRSVASI